MTKGKVIQHFSQQSARSWYNVLGMGCCLSFCYFCKYSLHAVIKEDSEINEVCLKRFVQPFILNLLSLYHGRKADFLDFGVMTGIFEFPMSFWSACHVICLGIAQL